MVQRTVIGPFSASKLGAGLWRLTTVASSGAEVLLQGVGPEGDALQDPGIGSLRFEWQATAVKLAIIGAAGIRHMDICGAIIHEPKPSVYERLPLASFDASARQFWRRVFLLMRIPGGRLLLRFMSRRNRAPSGDARP